MNRRDFLKAATGVVALAVVPIIPARDSVRDFLSVVRGYRPNGVVRPWRSVIKAEDLADAFTFVERYDLPVSAVLVHPDDWYGRHESVDSSVTHVVDIEGRQVGKLWGSKVFAHESVPVGTLYVVGLAGLRRENVRGESEGLSTIVLRGAS
jgi:TAT (twin-arginine translocation) pathway signal sequence